MRIKVKAGILIFLLIIYAIVPAQNKPRARDLGIPFEGQTGPLNSITDVEGIEVGYSTIISGEGKLDVGKGPVRTGVTAILPRGKRSKDPVFAAWFPLNGNGEMTGTTWIEESGFLEGPVMLTNTHSVGVVRDAVISWQVEHGLLFQNYSYPVIAETYDGWLSDINGFHVKPGHVIEALENAKTGPVMEGNVGGGTGMHSFEYKGGTGTSSRKIILNKKEYTVGVLVQSNFGRRWQLQIAGVPVGKEMIEDAPFTNGKDLYNEREGSIIVVVATDAPLLPHQLKRMVKRAALGLARTGSMAMNGSGDIFIAFSTANTNIASDSSLSSLYMVPNNQMDPLLASAMLATEEAIINAMIAAETLTGYDGHILKAIPHEELKEVLRKYNRLIEK